MKKTQVLEERIVLPTYREPDAQDMPIFAECRVHQRSSGNPYPNKVVCDVDRAPPVHQTYTAIRLENDYLRIVLLPELGGRIFEAYDKVNEYHFFYRQSVIKPALIGLLGSWISGGLEFNWPCHHRPSTFMPVDYTIEQGEDGSVTVWMSENEPLDRMKGMVGVRLRPDEAAIDTLMRVYNRTPQRRSFLWWENAAVPVNEHYRIFFPHDVGYVQFHYRKNVTTYPLASGLYNGIHMGENSVDIRLHKNTRQPTSYFCGKTKRSFFGGYDEGLQRGVVHAACRHTSIGKKMFTWAYNQLSSSWEKALTDIDGEYAELMASSYSDNQPDFAWLEPYETKCFSQRWYPIGAMGIPDIANEKAAMRFAENGVWLQTTNSLSEGAFLCGDTKYTVDAQPGTPVFIPCGPVDSARLIEALGNTLIADCIASPALTEMPNPLPERPSLEDTMSAQQLYLAGVHVDQYRDPGIKADAYYRHALLRDPCHLPSLIALAEFTWREGRFEEALSLICRAEREATAWNNHPECGRLFYVKGLILEEVGRVQEAYDAYWQAFWNADARGKAMTRIAAIDGREGNDHDMLQHAMEALRVGYDNALARAMKTVALWRLGRATEAEAEVEEALRLDKQDGLMLAILHTQRGDASWINIRQSDPNQQALDIVYDLMDMGEDGRAIMLLQGLSHPTVMIAYTLAVLFGIDTAQSTKLIEKAETLSFGHAYPSRHQEAHVLRRVLSHHPQAGKAAFGLACYLYHNREYKEAYDLWEGLSSNDPKDWQSLRCLAIASFSHMGKRYEALQIMQKALAINPYDPHLTWETAHLMSRLFTPGVQIDDFLRNSPVCDCRDDLAIERARALNISGQWQKALELMSSRCFVPCEGGEHAVAEQYMFAQHALGRAALADGDAEGARQRFRLAQVLPQNLGAGLWHEALLVPHRYFEGICIEKLGHAEEAEACYRFILNLVTDFFSDMHLPELTCYQAMCHLRLGHEAAAREQLIRHIQRYEKARRVCDPGFFKTTPFFHSLVEDASLLREYACNYQIGLALIQLPGQEKKGKALLQKCDPANLYARLALTYSTF